MTDDNKGNGHDTELLKFPCEFPIKVMGKKESDVKTKSLAIIQKHCPDYTDEPLERLSRDKNYISLTFTVNATSKEQLDEIYTELTQCEDVLMAL